MKKKVLVSEVDRVREIMGLSILMEQPSDVDPETTIDLDVVTPTEEDEFDKSDNEADMEKAGYIRTAEAGEYKTAFDGKPYELFLAKSDTLSKAYLEVSEYDELDSKILYYEYRRINPYIEGGYKRDNMKVDKWTLEEWLEKQEKWNIDARMSAAKDDKWFKPGRQLGDAELEEWKEKFGDMVKKYIGPIPDGYASAKEHKLYEKYKKNPRYYLDKRAYKKYVEEFFSNKGIDELRQGNTASLFEKKLKKLEDEYIKTLKKQNFTEKYQYSNKKGKKKEGWEKNPDYNPEGAKSDKQVVQAKGEIGDVNFSPTDRYVVMEKINSFVENNYEGDYEAATSKKVYKRKGVRYITKGWSVSGVKQIVLRPKKIKIKEVPAKETVYETVSMMMDIAPNATEGQLFANNLWNALPYFEAQLDLMVENALIQKANVEEKVKGAAVTMFLAKEICTPPEDGKGEIDCSVMIPWPYTISSSCSKVTNCVDDQGMRLKSCGEGKDKSNPSHKLVDGGSTKPAITFEQLSKNRANTAMQLVAQKLGAIGVKMYDPKIVWEGKNGDGTSGPSYTKNVDPVDSEEYKAARYVEIKLAIGYTAEQSKPVLPEPETYKVGDLHVTISKIRKDWCGIWCWFLNWPLWRWKFKPFKQRSGRTRRKPRGGFNTTKCPDWL